MRLVLLAFGFAVWTIAAVGQTSSATYGPCSVRIAVATDGGFYDILHNGVYKRSPRTLEQELRGGCYNDANPSRVTSVVLEIADGAPPARTESLYKLLERNGWTRSKVLVEPWSGLKPR
jgi:hypothetical protein